MSKINEKELNGLFKKFKSGDNKAFEMIYSKYNKLVYGIAFNIIKNKTDAEDIMQIIFTKIYDMDKEKIAQNKCACWLYSLTKNETFSFIRKRSNHVDLEEIYELENDNNEIDNIIEKEKYNNLISKLNEKEREVVSLKLISKFSFDEIGKMLDIPSSTAKWRYYRALHSLGLVLRKYFYSFYKFHNRFKCFLYEKASKTGGKCAEK